MCANITTYRPLILSAPRKRVNAARLDRMLQAARWYYDNRKLHSRQCGACGATAPTPAKAGDRCIACGVVWKHAEGRIFGAPRGKARTSDGASADAKRQSPVLIEYWDRLTQEDVATLLSTPTTKLSRSEVQRLLTEAEEFGLV